MKDIERIILEAKSLLCSSPRAQQAVVLKSKSGRIYSFATEDWEDADKESDFLRILKNNNDTKIERIACVWQDGFCLDLPSMRLRKALIEMYEANKEALILLFGEDTEDHSCYNLISLGATMQ